MENVENILEKLFEYFKVVNAAELSEKINTSQKTISNWKVRNSISAVKKKCRELSIYNEIFGDENTNINNFQNSEFSGNSTGIDNSSNKNNNSNSIENDMLECDDFTKSLFKQLCVVYEDKSILHAKLFELIQNAKTN